MPLLKEAYFRLHIDCDAVFDTAFHVGSGSSGASGADAGILTDHLDLPALPGSSIKGVLRNTVERLVAALGLPDVWACGLQNGLLSDRPCIGGGVKDETYRAANKRYQDSGGTDTTGIESARCSVCTLFGSPLSAGRLFIADAELRNPEDFVRLHRDGVGIDRDSGTAVKGIKYDFDVANPGLTYGLSMDVERATEQDVFLLGIGLLEWCHAGVRLGGKTTRGLGYARVLDKSLSIGTVDLADSSQKRNYVLRGQLEAVQDPMAFLQDAVDLFLG